MWIKCVSLHFSHSYSSYFNFNLIFYFYFIFFNDKAATKLNLECPLCKDIYQEPKTLRCLHSFCFDCLKIYIERNHSNTELRCPICRTSFQSKSKEQLAMLSTDPFLLDSINIYNSLKNSGPQKNQKLVCVVEGNDATHYCIDCQDHFCEACTKAHQTMKTSKHHQIASIKEIKKPKQGVSIPKANPQTCCPIHEQKELELYCDECQGPICSLCVAKHPSHKISTLPRVIESEKQSLRNLINKVKDLLMFIYLLFRSVHIQ